MSRLDELIERHTIQSTPIYVHTVTRDGEEYTYYRTGRTRTYERGEADYDVYDVLLTHDVGPSLYGGLNNRRTLLTHGYGQSISKSRRRNGDVLTPPTTAEILLAQLQHAYAFEAAADDWQEWAREEINGGESKGFDDGMNAYNAYQVARERRNDLETFLGDAYGEFLDFVGNGES
jgi:hypothetical protein